MKILEFGQPDHPTLLFLHGGGLSWWNYREAAELLKDRYHVLIPILPGHAGSDKDFINIEACAKDLIEYIDLNHNGFVTFIGGLSLGGQILTEMLALKSDICKYALIESALVTPMKMTHGLIKPAMDMSFPLIKQKWFARLQFQYLKIKPDLFDDYYRDTCKITKENMTAFLKSNSNYTVRKELMDTKAKVHILVGGKEQANMIRSARMLYRIIPGSSLSVMDGLYHGELSMNHAEDYVDMVESIMKSE